MFLLVKMNALCENCTWLKSTDWHYDIDFNLEYSGPVLFLNGWVDYLFLLVCGDLQWKTKFLWFVCHTGNKIVPGSSILICLDREGLSKSDQ